MNDMTTRRDFALAAGGFAALAEQVVAQTSSSASGVPTRVLGRTGQRVSMICLGGWHIGIVKDEQEAIKIMHAAIDEGMTFFDNAWDYHDGGSEEIMGKALAVNGKRKRSSHTHVLERRKMFLVERHVFVAVSHDLIESQ